jgi:hypothetical protein
MEDPRFAPLASGRTHELPLGFWQRRTHGSSQKKTNKSGGGPTVRAACKWEDPRAPIGFLAKEDPRFISKKKRPSPRRTHGSFQITTKSMGDPRFVSKINKSKEDPRFVSKTTKSKEDPRFVSKTTKSKEDPRFVSNNDQVHGGPTVRHQNRQVQGGPTVRPKNRPSPRRTHGREGPRFEATKKG